MMKYYYNRGGTGRAACNRNLVLRVSSNVNRGLRDSAIEGNRNHVAICKHCVKIVLKETGGSNWEG